MPIPVFLVQTRCLVLDFSGINTDIETGIVFRNVMEIRSKNDENEVDLTNSDNSKNRYSIG